MGIIQQSTLTLISKTKKSFSGKNLILIFNARHTEHRINEKFILMLDTLNTGSMRNLCLFLRTQLEDARLCLRKGQSHVMAEVGWQPISLLILHNNHDRKCLLTAIVTNGTKTSNACSERSGYRARNEHQNWMGFSLNKALCSLLFWRSISSSLDSSLSGTFPDRKGSSTAEA